MDLRTYMKSLNAMGLISVLFETHFKELGYSQNSKTSFNLRNNITLELFPNSQEPCMVLADHSTNTITTFLFDPSIAFGESHVIVMQRMYENVKGGYPTRQHCFWPEPALHISERNVMV